MVAISRWWMVCAVCSAPRLSTPAPPEPFPTSTPPLINYGTNDEADVTITDNDTNGVTVSPTDLTVTEGSSSTYTVKLNTKPSANVVVTVADPTDNTDVTTSPESLTFTPSNWSTTQTVRVRAAQDADALDETAAVTHSASSTDADYNGISISSVTVTVTDDEDVPVTVSFESATSTVMESDDTSTTGVEEHKATIEIKLTQDPERTVIIPITSTPQGSTTDADFRLSAPGVTFNSGETEKTITFTAKHDTLDDDGDKVKLSFGSLPDAVSRGTVSETVVSITDDDQTALTVSFENSAYNVDEGSEVDIKVTLSPAPGESIDIPITKTHVGGATADDYSGVPDILTFGENDTEKTITFSATDDGETESGEQVRLSFSSTLDSRISTGTNAQATVRIYETSGQKNDGNSGVCDNQANKIILLEDTGEISQAGERDFWEVETEPRVIYIIEVLGADSGLDVLEEDTHSGDLTLADPDIISLHMLDPVTQTYSAIYGTAVDNSGHGRNAVAVTRPGYGTFRIEVAASDGGTGTYQIKVRVNNVCAVNEDQEVYYPWFGGPRGYRLDAAPDSTTNSNLDAGPGLANQPISRGGFLGDNWDENPDVDWFRTEFQQGYEYTVDVWTEQGIPEKYQATQLRIMGIHDDNGDPVANTASEGSGKHASTVFRPDATATFYVSIGSEDPDRDGLFSIRATDRELDPGNNLARHNSPVSGGPTTDGEARVGRKLTAVTQGIQDDDGMENAVLTYQWIRLDLNQEGQRTDIYDATDPHYTPRTAEEGSAIGVQVSFTDDAGTEESLTSPLKLVLPPIPLTVSLTESSEAHDGTSAFSFRIAFSDPIKNDYKNVRDHAFRVTDGTVTLARRDDGDSRSWEIKVQPEGNAQVEILLPADRPCGKDGAICTKDGRVLQNALELLIPGPPNNPATGVPVITGTTQVGQTLEADTTGIQDEDGLEHAVFTYQWSAGGSYKLTSQDEGLAIQLRVSFTDDAGNAEQLTSAATATVAARPNSEAPGVPTLSGTAQVGETLTADTSGIVDADGLSGVSYSYQWVRSDGTTDSDITGAMGTTYTLVLADEGRTVRVRVSFTDDAGHAETLTSVPTASVAARSNRIATGTPTISGTAQVGETLTVDISGIADKDGLANVSYGYQWVRSDGAIDTDIPGAAALTYVLVSADEDRTIRVRVSFTDDAGHAETLTSEATGSVDAASGDSPIWGATMTAAPLYVDHGYSNFDGFRYGSLTTSSFEIDEVTYTVNVLDASGWIYIGFDREVPIAFTLDVDGTRLESSDASFTSYSYSQIYQWDAAQTNWSDGQTVELRLYGSSTEETD